VQSYIPIPGYKKRLSAVRIAIEMEFLAKTQRMTKKGMTGNKNELILLGVLARERKMDLSQRPVCRQTGRRS